MVDENYILYGSHIYIAAKLHILNNIKETFSRAVYVVQYTYLWRYINLCTCPAIAKNYKHLFVSASGKVQALLRQNKYTIYIICDSYGGTK